MSINLSDKYRPKRLDEMVGQDAAVMQVKMLIDGKAIPNLLLGGPSGVGKTTLTRCLANELFNGDAQNRIEELNASEERGIGMVRERIKKLTKTAMLKIIFLDEAEKMTPEAQDALRGLMEPGHARSTIFVLATNNVEEIIPPLRSRCVPIYMGPIDDEVVLRRLIEICQLENIDFSSDDARKQLTTIVGLSCGDLRKALTLLQASIYRPRENEPGVARVVLMPIATSEPADLAALSFKRAFNGDMDAALGFLEDAYLIKRGSVEEISNALLKEIRQISDVRLKARLITKLGDFTARAQTGGVLVHFAAFLSWAYVIQHVDPGQGRP
jgi:replication factor C small subunit